MSVKTIFALGNAAPDDYAINEYIVHLPEKVYPTVCFLCTASGDHEGYIQKLEDAYGGFYCQTRHLGLFKLPSADLRSYLLESDVIYVGGGNTRSMMAIWREWGVDDILKDAYEAGIVLCGPSAGAICWFEQGITDSIPGLYATVKGLELLPGSFCPHYDDEPERRPVYMQMVLDGILKPGYAVEDRVGVLFRDGKLKHVVSAAARGMAYHVATKNSQVYELPLDATLFLKDLQ